MSMQDSNSQLEMLQALAAGTDPVTGEVSPADSPSNQREIIRALFFANQGLTWSEEENAVLAERIGNNLSISIPATGYASEPTRHAMKKRWIFSPYQLPAIVTVGIDIIVKFNLAFGETA
jgi:hypothetical protein